MTSSNRSSVPTSVPRPCQAGSRLGQEDLGHAARGLDAQSVPVACDIFDGDPASLARDAHLDCPALLLELGEPWPDIQHRRARRDLVRRQIAEAPQQVVELVDRPRAPLAEPLQLELELLERSRIKQLAQLLLPQ